MPPFAKLATVALLSLYLVSLSHGQTSTGSISGVVTDQNHAAITGATVTVRNTATGLTRSTTTDEEGRYNFLNLPTGGYELTIDAPNFRKYSQKVITVEVNQTVSADAALEPGHLQAAVTVDENASMLNTATAEVSTRFDSRRLSELPLATNRNALNSLLSAPGVSQLAGGQTSFSTGLSFTANGGRLRSNNFMIDGQDMNDPTFSGAELPLNNPDAIQEVQIVTNQFKAEYGRNSGSVVNFVGKSGTNQYHGSLFWFHNDEYLNSCNNLDKVANAASPGFCNKAATTDARRRAPERRENQVGFTFGGPLTFFRFGDGDGPKIWKGTDKTFFFVDYQRWSDRAIISGPTLKSAPTAAGRAVLSSLPGDRPQVQALLNFVPAGTPNDTFAHFTLEGVPYQVPLGDLTGSSQFVFDDRQGSVRIDHRFSETNLIYARFRFDAQHTTGNGQVTPPGLTSVNTLGAGAATIVLNTILSDRLSNEVRASWTRFSNRSEAEFQSAKTIPSMEITGLEMVNSNSVSNNVSNRTAIGFPTNLPGARANDTYSISDALSYFTGSHSMKFGHDVRRTHVRIAAFQNARGALRYMPRAGVEDANDITSFIEDRALTASINFPLPGGETVYLPNWNEFYAFAQDEWKIWNNFTLTLGVRYEYPGDTFSYLEGLNARVVAANGNDPTIRYAPRPKADTNNFIPRIGFNWNPRTSKKGFLGFITGGEKLVVRGGYSRVYDANFINLNAIVFYSFPFLWTQFINTGQAFTNLRDTTAPVISQPNHQPRSVFSEDFRSPAADQFSFETQRELSQNLIMTVGYVRTRGTGLFQIVDANPCKPGNDCVPPRFGNRVNPDLEAIGMFANSGSSTYDALQVSFTKRLSNNFSAGLHYTWSSYIDDVSDVFAPSGSEINVAQDVTNRRADRARSSYDRPHRLTGNFVYELPFYKKQIGYAGHFLGGWQVNSLFTFQSGAPFTVSQGKDPGCAVCGFATTVRPNLNTNLDLSSMSISEIRAAGGRDLFRELSSDQRVGNAGRNILRADALRLVDFGIIKNTRLMQTVRIQLRADMFNSLNSRNFGIPLGTNILALNFLDKWATAGGNRRIVLGARLVF